MSRFRLGRRDDAAAVRAPVAPGTVIGEVRGLRVDLGGRTVLHDVDLEVRTGEVLALVGPNGAGKSTLLGALAGDVAASSGTCSWTGPRSRPGRRSNSPGAARC